MRIDKFLKNARLIKRRVMAKEACDRERVYINGRPAKPGAEVKCGDIVLLRLGQSELRLRVLAVPESVRKDDAAAMYELLQQP